MFIQRKETLEADLASLEKVTEILSGSRDTARSRRLKDKINRVKWDDTISIFQRSKQSNFEPIRHLLQQAVSFINGQQLQRFIQNISSDVDITAAGGAIRQNIKQILQQLAHQDDAFEDLTAIVSEFVAALEFGILLACEPEYEDKESEVIFSQHTLTPSALGKFVGKKTSNNGEPELQALRVLALRANIEGKDSFEDKELALLDTLFARILKVWERRERDDAREREEATKMYHFKGLEVFDPEDDEAGVAEMFSEGHSTEDESQNKRKVDIQILGSNVSSLHQAIFLGNQSDTPNIASLQRDLGHQMRKSEKTIVISPGNVENFVPMMVLDISSADVWLNNSSESSFNFYKDENPTEVKKVVEFLLTLKNRVADLVALWPENDILRDIDEKTTEILRLPLKTPINSVLAKLEGLHSAVHQWQQVASKEYSLNTYLDHLTTLIVSWRKLELQTWSSLFSQEEAACKKQASVWWFHIYKAVRTAIDVQDQDISAIRITLAETLHIFLRQSTVGELESRLKLLEGIENQLNRTQSSHAQLLRSTVHNIYQLHAQFTNAATEHISTNRVKLEKDMRETILLASWKDTNVNALRESTRRSHYQLYKIVKKYRAILATPVSTVSKAGDLSKLEMLPLSLQSRLLPATLESDISVCAASIADWQSRPARLMNVSSTVSKMQQSHTTISSSQTTFEMVDQFSDHILQRAQELRDATPSKLTKENTTEIRRLQDAKRKTVNEALKSLRQMGFKSNLSQKELSGQTSIEQILGLASKLEGESFNSRVQEINSILVATLENLPKTRGVFLNIPADVNVPDFVRGSKYFEHGLSMVVQQRERLASDLKTFHQLKNLVNQFMVSCERREPLRVDSEVKPRSPSDFKSLHRDLCWLRANIDFALKVVDAEEKFVPGDYGNLREILNKWKQWTIASSEILMTFPKAFPSVILPENEIAVGKISSDFENMASEFHDFGKTSPKIEHIVGYLQPWIPVSRKELATNGQPFTSSAIPDSLVNLDRNLQTLCDTILAQLQPEASNDDLVKKVGSPEKTVLLEHEKLLVSRVSAGSASVIRSFELFGSSLGAAMSESPDAVTALMRLMAPIIVEYENICCRDLLRRLDFHRSICRLTHILSNFVINIGTNGFCAPSEGSAEAGGAGQLESGTGLGDGEGEEDISNDVAPDEDLSEIAKQKEEDGASKDFDAHENAVENDDIDGMSESGSEKSDKEGEGEEGEEEDVTDEMGKVDDSHGLDSLDKDFWDNPADEPQEEVDAGGDGKLEENATSNQEKAKKEEKQPKDSKDLPNQEDMEVDDAVSENSAEDENDGVEKRDNDNLNEHVPEVERLDISDDFNLEDVEEMEDEDDGDISEGEGEDDGLDPPLDNTADKDMTMSDGEEDEEEDEMGEYDPKTAEEDSESPPNGDEEDKEDEDEDMLQKPNEDPVESGIDESTAPPSAGASKAAPSSANVDTDDLDTTSGPQDVEKNDQQETALENSVPNATDGKGDSGKAEYRAGHRQSDMQPNEQRLENGLKKLGDLLEKVHRTPMEILDSETSTGPKDIPDQEEQKQSQFEHVGEDDRQAAAQALGTATTEEAHAIDESMVIDSTRDQVEQPPTGGEEEPIDNSAEGKDGNPSDEHAGFDNAPQETEDVPAAPQTKTEENPDTAMEVEVPRLIGDSKHGELEDMDDDMELDEDEQSLTEPGHTATAFNEEAQSLWKLYENKTRILSLSLTEQLRLILEPTLSTKLRGDYRTGKRLNMKRIIPYIASDYKKDKIWMRRTKPSKRQYQVMIALDDSKSMSESRCVELTFESIALVARALSHLEVGQISMVSFGETTRLIHPFEQPFTAQSGANVFAGLTFMQTKTNMKSLVETSIKLFREARQMNQQSDLWQLELIISDGICEDHQEIQRLVRLAHFEKIVLIFVIIDAAGGAIAADNSNSNSKSKGSSSILDMKEAVFTDQGDGRGPKLQVNRYMDTFPFSYYLIIRRIEDLPGMLSTALRQWFSQAAEAS
ncbi:Midasin [Arthrobotrys entomopaga]|nr:Midasin [Arthrobotrys entomopaga]